MKYIDPLDELLVCRLDTRQKNLEPCTIVIFGASGDLTARKLIPALYHLFIGRQLPTPVRIVGFARREKSDAQWREELRGALEQFSRTKPIDPRQWDDFAQLVSYCRGDLNETEAYTNLGHTLKRFQPESLQKNLLFYLATQPSQFATIIENLAQSGLLAKGETGGSWQRVVVEKPFGHDLTSARELNEVFTRFANEKQIFRIDHYLGKETIQNILMFRFSNAIFENLWHRQMVDHVQIILSETFGVGARGGFYEETGALRDVVQNHLLQVLALVAMEPPTSLEAEAIRDEKVKLLRSIRILDAEHVPSAVVRGQYTTGTINGNPRAAYREEPKVRPDSNVETYVALKLFIDNWRWSGVPFYLRTGKNLPVSASEVRVQFCETPHVLFAAQCGPRLDANSITLRLQPNEGISLRFNGKIPGPTMQLRPVRMHFSYDSEFGAYTPEAYERLLLEAMGGDPTLFLRRDEVEAAWNIVDPIRQGWDNRTLVKMSSIPPALGVPKLRRPCSSLMAMFGGTRSRKPERNCNRRNSWIAASRRILLRDRAIHDENCDYFR